MRYLIPIASGHDLFPREEFHFPKPLIEIDGEPMVSRVIANLKGQDPEAEFIFVVRAEDCRVFSLDRAIIEATDGRAQVVALDKPTAGAACSALLAIDLIDDDKPLVVCNGDQILESGIAAALAAFGQTAADAGVISFPSVHPRWSYVRLGPDGHVIEAAEKRVISRRAIAGFYYFRTGAGFVRAAQSAILNERGHGGVYYIAPLLNEIVLEGGKIVHHDIPAEAYQSLFSPKRLESYEHQIQNRRILGETQHAAAPLTIVIPMAGLGSRFAQAGYEKPKPFIDVAGKTMIERVMDNLAVPGARFVLIARREHLEQEPETVRALQARGDLQFVPIDFTTEGATCTVLTARAALDPSAPLLIANCDQIVDFSCAAYVEDARQRNLDGSILTFRNPERDVKWSFARVDQSGLVAEVREKVAISDIATVGLYYFATAQGFIDAAVDMISRNDRVNNEFYVCPVYNYAIRNGGRIGIYEVPEESMHGTGTPADLKDFLKLRYGR